MPFIRKSFITRRARKGPAYRRRMYTAGRNTLYKKRTAFNKNGLLQTKLRYTTTLTTDGTGTIQMWINNTNPTAVVNGSGACPDFSSLSAIYDSYRVRGIKLQFIPNRPTDPSTTTDYHPVYVVYDPDGAAPFTVNDFIQYENMKYHNIFRPWKYYHGVPLALATGTSGVVQLKGGWMDIATPMTTSAISIFADLTIPQASEKFGDLLITYYIQFKSRR